VTLNVIAKIKSYDLHKNKTAQGGLFYVYPDVIILVPKLPQSCHRLMHFKAF